jgi:hypothetical protein
MISSEVSNLPVNLTTADAFFIKASPSSPRSFLVVGANFQFGAMKMTKVSAFFVLLLGRLEEDWSGV